MRKGFTLVECMLAGTLLSVAALALLQGLGVLSRVAGENAEMLEADAIVWDAIATEFNRPYEVLKSGNRTRTLTEDEAPRLQPDAVLTVRVGALPRTDNAGHPLKTIAAWIEWGGPNNPKALTNFVYRSVIGRGEPEE